MSDDVKRQKILDKIEKLLALSSSPNENEALAAAEKAHILLAEHGLSRSDIVGPKDPTMKDELLTDYARWVKPLLLSIGKLYFCGYYYQTFPIEWARRNGIDLTRRHLLTGGGATFLRHSFIGEKANIIVAKVMAEYIISAMEKLCKKGAKAIDPAEQGRYRLAFMNACSASLCSRLYARRMESRDHTTVSNGTNLPALRSLYQQAEDRVDQWLKDNMMKLKTKKRRVAHITHQKGAIDGLTAGGSIGLDYQLSQTDHMLD